VKIKEFVLSYLVFSKKERLGIYVLSVLTIMVWAIPYFFSQDKTIEDVLKVTYLEIDSAKKILVAQQTQFNKNATRYSRYPNESVNGKTSYRKYNYENNTVSGALKYNKRAPLDINEADSIAFEKLPAIGEKLSSRIVRYRERLGGFISISQVKEVYGISDSVFNLISPLLMIDKDFKPRHIEINRVDYAALRKHPYATHEFTKLVIAYRKVNGAYKGKLDLEKVEELDKSIIQKLLPYLAFND
jgi:DNA uptake protein ComE-like DNA-binding protein